MLRNIIVIVTLLLVALLPFVTKEHDAEVPSGIRIIRNLPYVQAEPANKYQQLDLYLPRMSNKTPMPLIVFIHGGGWKEGDKKDSPALDIANHGYAAASINYRLAPKDIFPAQIYDCKAAIRWLKAHAAEYNYDPNRIGVWGISAGGHLGAMLGTTGSVEKMEGDLGGYKSQTSNVQAVCDWCGPTDMLTFCQQAMEPRFRQMQPEQFVEQLLGGKPEDRKELAIDASPVSYISADDPPFMVVHSLEDPVVPFEQSNDFVKKLEAAKVKVKFLKINGHEHVPFTEGNLNSVYDFFKDELKSDNFFE